MADRKRLPLIIAVSEKPARNALEVAQVTTQIQQDIRACVGKTLTIPGLSGWEQRKRRFDDAAAFITLADRDQFKNDGLALLNQAARKYYSQLLGQCGVWTSVLLFAIRAVNGQWGAHASSLRTAFIQVVSKWKKDNGILLNIISL